MSDRATPLSIDDIAEAFVAEVRRGHGASVEEFVARYPAHAEEIRDLFPAIAMLERLKRAPGDATTPVAEQGAAAHVSPGMQLGDYRLLREIGRGGMGLVFEAEQESLSRRVAVKILPERLARNPAGLERFRREARAVARLHHTNIVPVFGVGESDGIHFYVMQYIAGEGLDAVLRQVRRLRNKEGAHRLDDDASRIAESLIIERDSRVSGRNDNSPSSGDFPESAPAEYVAETTAPDCGNTDITESARSPYYRRVAEIALQAADALAYAHGQGVLHRDVKPANLLLDLAGTVWLTDFGLAKESESGELTGTGDLVGTLRFMPPERLQGKSLAEGDIYGLGLTLYELLTLRPAFHESDVGKLASRLSDSIPIAPRQIERGIPKDLETIVLKCIAPAPQDRYRRAELLAEDLRRYLSDRPILARRFGPFERSWRWCRRNPLVAGLSAALVAVLVSLAIFGNLSASRYREKHEEGVEHLQRAESAESDLRRNNAMLRSALAESLVAQAHALRVSGEQGCQLRALELLDQSAAIERLPSLRNEVIAALTKFDARPRRVLTHPPLWKPASAAFDNDLRRMAVFDRDRIVRLLDVSDGRELFQTDSFQNGPPNQADDWLSLAFSLDGQSVIFGRSVAPELDELWIWDLRQPKSPPRLLVRGAYFFPPVVMPDGASLAIVPRSGGIQLIDLTTGMEKRRWAEGMHLRWPAFSADGKQVAFGIHDASQLVIWNVKEDREETRFKLPDKVYGVAWSSDGKLVAAGCGDHQAYVFDAQLKRRHSVLAGHRMHPMHVAFIQPGDWLASWDSDLNLIVSDPISGKPLLSVRGGLHAIGANGKRWIVLDTNGLSEWEVAIPSAMHVVRHRFLLDPLADAWMEGPRSVDISPNGRLLATSDLDGLRLYSMTSPPKELAWMRVGGSHAAFFDADGALYSSSSLVGLRRRLVEIKERDGIATLQVGLPKPFGPVVQDDRPPFFFDATRRWMLLGDAGARRNHLLRMPDGAEERPVFQRHFSMLCALDRDARWVVTSDMFRNETTVWNARKNVVAHTWPSNSWGRFTPCGRWLLLRFAAENRFRLFRAETWKEERSFACRDSSYSVPAISPDGRIIALCEHKAIRLLDFESFEPIAELPTGPGNLEYVGCVFSPDGSQLVSARRGHRVHVWDLRAIRAELKRRGLDWDLPEYAPPVNWPEILPADVPPTFGFPRRFLLKVLDRLRYGVRKAAEFP